MQEKNRRRRICVIPGDGIGKEVVAEGIKLLDKLNHKYSLGLELIQKDWGADKWLSDGIGLPEGALKDLEDNYDAIYFGALGDPRIPDMAHGREILLGLRFGLDLYVNHRPIKLLDGSLCPIKNNPNIDITIFRENTEDSYVSVGGNFKQNTPDEVSIDESVHTYKGVKRIIEHAFKYANSNSKNKSPKITLGDKSNAIRFGGSLWQRVFKEVAQNNPNIKTEHKFVDVLAMELVTQPESFDIIVTSNLFGDILSDLGAGLVGGLGLAASANIHPGKIGLFEPVHGSAPDIAGQNKANPMAAFATAALMLEYLGANEAAANVDFGIKKCLGSDELDIRTASTKEISDFVLNLI